MFHHIKPHHAQFTQKTSVQVYKSDTHIYAVNMNYHEQSSFFLSLIKLRWILESNIEDTF
jgi:hypothetical protein